jgi:hypothetical protein
MCYSINSSYFNWLKTFLIGISLLIIYDDYDTKWVVSFILLFTQMQIFESIAWANMDHINNNKSINSMLVIIILLQPIISTLFALNKSKNNKLLILLILLVLSLLYLIYLNKNIIIKPGINGHLTWVDNKKNHVLDNKLIFIIYMIGLLYPFLYLDNNINKVIIMLYIIFSYLYSLNNYYKTDELSSYWCYMSTSLMIIYALLKIFN